MPTSGHIFIHKIVEERLQAASIFVATVTCGMPASGHSFHTESESWNASKPSVKTLHLQAQQLFVHVLVP